MKCSWILDSGGAGRGAWQGGVLYEFMLWCRENDRLPTVTMGASAGGYAAADVATGAEKTVLKGWTVWGEPEKMRRSSPDTDPPEKKMNGFRKNLHASIYYVMEEEELTGVFDSSVEKQLLVFTTRVRRSDRKKFLGIDRLRFFMKSATRKLPGCMKYLPGGYVEDPVIFATNLPGELESEYVRPMTRANYHAVIEASCLVPLAMGLPVAPENMVAGPSRDDRTAVFIDGGYAVKMPMAMLEEDPRFRELAQWAWADKTIVFCCDPGGVLWENSSRLRSLNTLPSVEKSIQENRLLIIYPDHKVEAGFLCTDNQTIMRTFNRGREQGQRLLQSDKVRKFFWD